MANTTTAGQASWADFELPWGHTGDLSWAELEVSFGKVGYLSWAELWTPLIATAGELSWSELQTPLVATAGKISWTQLQVPFFPTAGEISWAEFQLKQLETAGRVSYADFEIPSVLAAGVLSAARLVVPKSHANSFVLSDGTVDIYRAANLAAEQSAGQITHVDLTSAGVYYTEPEDILITAVHSANNVLSEDAVLGAELGALTTKAGEYRTTKGFLSADKFLQDESYYNEHTYVVRVAESFDRWKAIYKKVLHPAGFQLVGEFVSVDAPSNFTTMPDDANVAISGGVTTFYDLTFEAATPTWDEALAMPFSDNAGDVQLVRTGTAAKNGSYGYRLQANNATAAGNYGSTGLFPTFVPIRISAWIRFGNTPNTAGDGSSSVFLAVASTANVANRYPTAVTLFAVTRTGADPSSTHWQSYAHNLISQTIPSWNDAAWHHAVIEITPGTGTFTVSLTVDGTPIITTTDPLAGGDVASFAAATHYWIWFGTASGTSVVGEDWTMDIDDVLVETL